MKSTALRNYSTIRDKDTAKFEFSNTKCRVAKTKERPEQRTFLICMSIPWSSPDQDQDAKQPRLAISCVTALDIAGIRVG